MEIIWRMNVMIGNLINEVIIRSRSRMYSVCFFKAIKCHGFCYIVFVSVKASGCRWTSDYLLKLQFSPAYLFLSSQLHLKTMQIYCTLVLHPVNLNQARSSAASSIRAGVTTALNFFPKLPNFRYRLKIQNELLGEILLKSF